MTRMLLQDPKPGVIEWAKGLFGYGSNRAASAIKVLGGKPSVRQNWT